MKETVSPRPAAVATDNAPSRIEDYALIGDCRTAALVSRTGSIDWLCLPRFDSAACFAALLGDCDNGHWSIAPSSKVLHCERRYRDGTLVLETDFETATGKARLIDFMPLHGGASDLMRIVVGLSGEVAFETELVIRFDYGRTVPWVNRVDHRTIRALAGPDRLVIQSPVALKGEDLRTVGRFTVKAGDRVPFTLTYQGIGDRRIPAVDPETALEKTEAWWRAFSDRCPEVGEWTATVKRSLITLKALTFEPTGGIAAAATTSLPEKIGGRRNWDYRYCWLRDATVTLQAFMHLGYFEEAEAWREWLIRAVAGDPAQMQIMYGLGGERRLPEFTLPWLKGFMGSKPVRVGNAAAEQFQLDIYGEVADAMTQGLRGGLPRHVRGGALSEVILPFLEKAWRHRDRGIWEVRGPRRHFTHSKVLAWVAFDRAATLTGAQGEAAARWRRMADRVHAEICRKAFDPDLGSFVQYYGAKVVDASLLHIPLVGFLPADDPRVVGTVKMIEQQLMRDGLLLRYDTGEVDDGLPHGEGAFLACSFWLADVWVLLGRLDEARALFERLRSLCNDVGLLAEEYDARDGRMLGNFPQAFSHVGLINTALNLARAVSPAVQRTSTAG